MATGPSTATANAILNAICNATAYSIATPYIQLHTADPGAAGTTAVAGNGARKSVSFGVAASGAVSNDVAIAWSTSDVDTSEDYTHWSLWDAAAAGNFIMSGALTANPVVVGDEFTIPIGDLDLTMAVAS